MVEALEQQQRVMGALASFFTDKAGSKHAANKKRKQQFTKTDKPKKSRSSYLHYVCDEMPKIKAGNKELKQKEVMSILGDRWKKMDEVARMPYVARAANSKKEYDLAFGLWEAEQQKELQESLISGLGEEEKRVKKKKKKSKKEVPEESSVIVPHGQQLYHHPQQQQQQQQQQPMQPMIMQQPQHNFQQQQQQQHLQPHYQAPMPM